MLLNSFHQYRERLVSNITQYELVYILSNAWTCEGLVERRVLQCVWTVVLSLVLEMNLMVCERYKGRLIFLNVRKTVFRDDYIAKLVWVTFYFSRINYFSSIYDSTSMTVTNLVFYENSKHKKVLELLQGFTKNREKLKMTWKNTTFWDFSLRCDIKLHSDMKRTRFWVNEIKNTKNDIKNTTFDNKNTTWL